MKPPVFLLALEADRWFAARTADDEIQLREVGLEGTDGPMQAVEELSAVLAELGYGGQAICLGLPSEMVFAAEIDCGNLPRKGRRTAMLYRLEEQLPLEAERLTTDFLPARAGRALGLAVETERIRNIVDRLAEAGIETAAVCPTAMLALWQASNSTDAAAEYTAVVSESRLDLFRMLDGHPSAWYVTSQGAAETVRCLKADMLSRPAGEKHPSARLVGHAEDGLAHALRDVAGVQVTTEETEPAFALAACAASHTLEGRPAGWVNFRRDGLAVPRAWCRFGGLLRCAGVLAVATLAVAAGMFVWRSGRYQARTRAYEGEQAAIYRELFPNTSVPPNVKSRLRSELAKLEGVSGAGADLPDRPSALDTLRQIATSLPTQVRLRLLEMRIGPAGVFLDGQARSHTDAEVIAQSLVRGGIALDPPQTERLGDGEVGFTLAGGLAKQSRATRVRGSEL